MCDWSGRTEKHLLVGSLDTTLAIRLTGTRCGHQAATGIRMWSGHWTLSQLGQDGMTVGEGESRIALTGGRKTGTAHLITELTRS